MPFGEHSDWASLHRVMNSAIVPGHAIVTGVEQGIYATVSMADKFIVESELASFKNESFECEMDSKNLEKQHRKVDSFHMLQELHLML